MNFAKIDALGTADFAVLDLAPLLTGGHDAADRLADGIRTACEKIGFFYITGHGIPTDCIARLFAQNRRFHALPDSRKREVQLNGHFRGHQPLGGSRLRISSVSPARRSNHSESFFMRHRYRSSATGANPIDGDNRWPCGLVGFEQQVCEYHDRLWALCEQLLPLLARVLGEVEQDFIKQYFSRPSTTLRLLHYPPHPGGSPADLFGIAPHTDYGFLTLLAQDDSGGLEIRLQSGEWVPIPPIADTFVVNVGDALSMMTNGRFASTPHRVVNRSEIQSRYSAAFFFDPNLDAILEPLPAFYANIRQGSSNTKTPHQRFGDYFLERLSSNYPTRAAT